METSRKPGRYYAATPVSVWVLYGTVQDSLDGEVGTTMDKVNLAEKLSHFTDHWSPRVVGELNGQHVKLAKLKISHGRLTNLGQFRITPKH